MIGLGSIGLLASGAGGRYVIGDSAFIGDTMFMPDFGTARADFPGGSATQLYNSIQRILALPDETRLFLCHDYKAPGRNEFCWQSTVREQKANNLHVGGGNSRYSPPGYGTSGKH